MDKNDELRICYPEIFRDATAWCHADTDHFPDERVVVTEDGLKHLLRTIAHAQRVAVDAILGATQGLKIEDIKGLSSLLNRTSQVWCEGTLIVSGLFVVDGETLINSSPDVELLGSEPRKTAKTNAT